MPSARNTGERSVAADRLRYLPVGDGDGNCRVAPHPSIRVESTCYGLDAIFRQP
jgi:hypothetical protein